MFLFSFLLIILVVPLLVSFNLDPQVYQANAPKVAGVATIVNDDIIDFIIEEDINASNRIFIDDSKKEGNKYEMSFKIAPGSDLNDSLRIGKIINKGSKNINLGINLFSDKKAIEGVNVSAKLNNEEQLLFNGEEFRTVRFELEPDGVGELEIKLNSDFAVKYSVEMKVEVCGVN